jgi:hypothetical protein
MSGSRIDKVRSTMEIMLKSLPEGTMFNIIGFGDTHQFLFPKSVEYNESK